MSMIALSYVRVCLVLQNCQTVFKGLYSFLLPSAGNEKPSANFFVIYRALLPLFLDPRKTHFFNSKAILSLWYAMDFLCNYYCQIKAVIIKSTFSELFGEWHSFLYMFTLFNPNNHSEGRDCHPPFY